MTFGPNSTVWHAGFFSPGGSAMADRTFGGSDHNFSRPNRALIDGPLWSYLFSRSGRNDPSFRAREAD